MLAELGLSVGALIAGKYRVEQVLAAGGMGVVLAARHQQLKQPVAIKLMLPETARSEESLARFRREASAAARLRSEHVVRIYDLGQTDDGAPFIVMERLEGMSLEKLLALRGPLPVIEAVEYVRQALLGLEEAHDAGIVHRDLKPQNLFLVQPLHGLPRLKILDFGISKLEPSLLDDTADTMLTSPQAVLGTPAYIAPEQLENTRDADARADLWSLGTILYELLTGKMLFEADSVGAALSKVLNMPIPSVRAQRPEVPEELDAALLRCLERDPSKRVASADELRRMLDRIAQSLRGDVASADTIPSLPPTPLPSEPGRAEQAASPRLLLETSAPLSRTASAPVERRRAPILLGALLALGLVAAALFALRDRSDGSPRELTSASTTQPANGAPPSTSASSPDATPPPPRPDAEASSLARGASSVSPIDPPAASASAGLPTHAKPPVAAVAPPSSGVAAPRASASAPTQTSLDELELHRRQ